MTEFVGWCPVHGPRKHGQSYVWVELCGHAVDGGGHCNLRCTGPGADAALQAMKERDELQAELRFNKQLKYLKYYNSYSNPEPNRPNHSFKDSSGDKK